MEYRIRTATPDDAAALLGIYRPYVEETAITFEVQAPSLEEFRNRIVRTMRKYPWIVLEAEDGTIVGYAYANTFKGRAAYNWSVETSIYLDRDCRGQGLGHMLYDALEDILRRMNIRNLNACIACTERENDPYLGKGSVRFHEKFGYTIVGTFHDCGFKLGNWYSMVWMEKIIGPHEEAPGDVIWFPDL